METLEHFEKLFAINCNDKTEKKNNGSKDLTYLSWCYAWAEVKKLYPDANYQIMKFGENKLPYVYDEKTGYMVFTLVEIEGVEHEMWLPVMDSANKAMKDKPYTYKVKEYKFGKFTGNYIDKNVEAATMFDINKTIMRCLTKNLAIFGLGLYIYAGEDLPENVDDKSSNDGKKTPYDFREEVERNLDKEPIQEGDKQYILDTCEEHKFNLGYFLKKLGKENINDVTWAEALKIRNAIDKQIEKENKKKEEVF